MAEISNGYFRKKDKCWCKKNAHFWRFWNIVLPKVGINHLWTYSSSSVYLRMCLLAEIQGVFLFLTRKSVKLQAGMWLFLPSSLSFCFCSLRTRKPPTYRTGFWITITKKCDGGNSNDISPHYWLNRNSCNTSRILEKTKICSSTYVI